ncbi:hypothetical protein FPF71_16665 [Algibacter amylolyticus]|uniref:Uncharacterized protein n=1 Tax=Algibacter amylolyticus TaxID=1608400 RepID=A0A5M7AU95_9FLAO|nr:hypothetical protein [Algibacter amylolyticus]KAA5821136.1 hypothetical protein F2B50_16665 [Algibacter amylolyticus]MBB5269781.1 hypothetical protein [Algibacter amylolyticus]TSJ72082.1 hypothetical protein FPF71_16665 [Algibacter amylolyticus]
MKINELNFKQVEKQDSVIIEFGKFDSLEVVQEIDAKLMRVIPLELGNHDMHEIALDDSHGRFFTYGKNAEKLFKCMLPVLKQYDFLKEATVHLNFTGGDKERDIDFKLSSVTAD